MKSRLLRTGTILSLALLFVSLFLPAVTVMAQDNGEGAQALEIAPPVVNLSADPGETVTAQLNLRDVSDGQLIVTNQINDFVADGEDGTPKILMEEGEPNPYSLRPWIVPLPQLLLEPRQIERLPVTINVPADAAPGGYFAVVRFTATAPELEGNGVSLSASLGALILLTVKGDAKEAMAVESFSVTNKDGEVTSLLESKPVNFVVRLKNNGNVHEQPAGQVTVTDIFGKTVGAVNINMPPRNVLPGSIRRFEVPFDSSVIGDKMLFGFYTAKLNVTYGQGNKKYTIEETVKTFWVIPYKLIGGIVLGLIIIFFLLKIGIQRYNRHIINQSKRRR